MTSPALQEIIALLGAPAAGNPAQYLHERGLEAAGLDWRFLTLEVDPSRLADAIAGVRAMGFRGCVLWGPLRGAALRLVDAASPAASFSQAASLIERQSSGLFAHNTDGRGALEAMRSHIDPAGTRVLILGAGAAGRATALELALAGAAEIVVCDRDADRAAALVEAITGLDSAESVTIPWRAEIEIPERVGIVISAIPADGTKPAFECLGMRNDLVVADFALVPQPSPMIAAAVRQGACPIDGLEIHAAKTAIDFQTLTGMEVDTDMLREALDEYLS